MFVRYQTMERYMNTKNITVVEIACINPADAMDFVDAYVTEAYWTDTEQDLTDEELDQLNDKHPGFVYEQVLKQIF